MSLTTIPFRTFACVVCALALILLPPEVTAMSESRLAPLLLPEPRELTMGTGALELHGNTPAVALPAGDANEACRTVVRDALRALGAGAGRASRAASESFAIGEPALLPLPATAGYADEGYVLVVSPRGVSASASSATGLLYAAQTLRQLARVFAHDSQLPCLTIRDSPEFRMRGIYVEGGQERFGRIVSADYLIAQIRQLSALKMNTMIVEAYNLFPYASFPACADSGTLSRADCERIFAEARRWHVTLVPSLQTLAQAYELVWGNEAGKPYRETTAPGLICPSNPDVYPFIKGLYRDLLTWFRDSPLIGIGCSEIDMQWQARYCPRCKARIDKGETVRDLLLGHAERCIQAVGELSRELGRPIRPFMWGDEFYMYGPGRDWVGLDRIPKNTVMGFWKYWPDYAGIGGLMDRGYDVLGISAMYNHCFYLADLSPKDPPKSWPSMEQTGVTNIAGMAADADRARRAHPGRDFLGVATASFSKHRLRAFDSIWYGFALNAECTWGRPGRPLDVYQTDFTRAFVRHYYDARTDAATETLARAYERLDRAKSQIELTNQTLHDVVGVVDTQEAGYIGNTVLGAWQRCGEMTPADPAGRAALRVIRSAAESVESESARVLSSLTFSPGEVGGARELSDLRLAATKIRNHAEREALMIDGQALLSRAPSFPRTEALRLLRVEARRWRAHRAEVAGILRRVEPLYSQGDPCGYRSVLRDVSAIRDHLAGLAAHGPAVAAPRPASVLIDERFASLDPARWEVLGEPKTIGGRMETRAPGGWGRLCGLLSRETFALDEHRPLVVEFDLTPATIGVDSQLFASAETGTDISFRFALAASRDHFAAHTQSSRKLGAEWTDSSPGWRQRAASPEITAGVTYRVRGEITRRTWRVVLRRADQGPWEMPFWDSGAVPMDDLAGTKLLFADVEPEGSAGSSTWGQIRIWRGK